ncbi:MAG TPA: universal stress protein [Caldimonas sp.]|nr:universal stress protein [Caldimonas sp.]
MYRRMLVPIDGSATAERGLKEAIGLARGEAAEMVVLHVVDDAAMVAEISASMSNEQIVRARERLEEQRQHGLALLAQADREATGAGLHVQTVLRDAGQERVGEIVVREAEEAGCDLIVMGTHGRRGFRRLVTGSVAEWVVRASATPVLLVRHPEAAHA